MPLSSNSLIHLTKKPDSLIGILENNFKIFYCKETIYVKGGSINGAFPMVSFCDIPLSEIKNHIFNYGRYGIGLRKKWAIKKGLNPVLYIEKKSDLGADLINTGNSMLSGKKTKKLEQNEYTIFNLFRYMKNYQCSLTRNGTTINDYRYSDEREWRYVPPDKDIDLMIPTAKFKDKKQKNLANSHLKDLRLEFTPDDITYIIINDESEITKFIDVLRNTKGKKYTHQQVERLITRIFTTTQIETDI